MANLMEVDALEAERRRLKALADLKISETEPDERLNRITRVASALFDVPIAMINLVTSDKIRFKACVGLPQGGSIDRTESFCALASGQDTPLNIPNTLLDKRFKDNPLVIGDLGIRSYVGKSLHARDGSRIGTLCILDNRPRKYTKKQLDLLADLAYWAETEINTNVLPPKV